MLKLDKNVQYYAVIGKEDYTREIEKYHKHFMLSAAYWYNYNLDETFEDRKGLKIFGDSAGFQLLSARTGKLKNLTLKALPFYKWQLEQCDYTTLRDIPTLAKLHSDYRIKETKKSGELMLKLKEDFNSKAKILNIIHGVTMNDMKLWYSSVKDLDLDGWCVPMKGNVYTLLFTMMYLAQYEKLKHIHIIGVSSCLNLLPVFYLASKMNLDLLSFDSSSPTQFAINCSLLLPNMLTYSTFRLSPNVKSGQFEFLNPENGVDIPCNCPFCKQLKEYKSFKDVYDNLKKTYTLIIGHNMAVYRQIYENALFLVNNNLQDEIFRKALWLKKPFQFVEDWSDGVSFDNLERKYKSHMKLRSGGQANVDEVKAPVTVSRWV